MIYSGIFDTHAHYDDERFNDDRAHVLLSLKDSGVCGVIDCGCDLSSSLKAIELSDKYGFVYAAVGIHPHETAEAGANDFDEIKKLFSKEKVVAVGEIGLDYHYDFSPREVQLTFFERQIILSKELDLPIIVHDREAHEDTMNLLKKYKPKGVVHCFSGSAEMAKEVLKLGMYIGLGGAVTFKNARKPLEVAAIIPDDRLLLETDCPYMAPVPFRGSRCDSTMIAYTAQKLAEERGCEVQSLIDKCRVNAKELFKLTQSI